MHTLVPNILSVAAYSAFAPICYADDGRPAGRDITFLQAFAALQGLALAVQFFPFDRLWERPGRDACDLACAGIAPLPERAAPGVVWSAPYFVVQRALLIRAADEHVLYTIADFAGRTIAVTRGSTAEHDALVRKPPSTAVVYYDDQQRALDDLRAGHIDAYATGDASCHHLVATYPGCFAVADVHPYTPSEVFAFALRAASELEAPLNAFIAEHKQHY